MNNEQERPKVGVGVLVVREMNGKKQVLMHQRKSEHGNGYWASGGGHLELGESLVEAALRELREEAGADLQVFEPRFLGVCNFTELYPKHYLDVSFLVHWRSGDPQNTEPEKMGPWEWFSLEELPSPIFPVVERYIEALKSGQIFFDSKAAITD